jgi:hypothetical protein
VRVSHLLARATIAVSAALCVTATAATRSVRGPLDAVVLNPDLTLTYALAAAFCAAGLAALAAGRVGDAAHVAGDGPTDRWSAQLASGLAGGTAAWATGLAAGVAAGALAGLVRAGGPHLGGRGFGIAAVGTDLALSLAAAAVGSALGAAIAVAVGSRVAAVSLLGASSLALVPAVGDLLQRATPALEWTTILPMGAVRVAVTGYAGINSPNPTQALRSQNPLVGVAVAAGWMVASAFVAEARFRRVGWGADGALGRRLRLGAGLGAGVAAAVAAGLALPPALAGAVPWRWQPDWRHARATGWASDQTLLAFGKALAAGDTRAASARIARGATLDGDALRLDDPRLTAFAGATRIEVTAAGDLQTPLIVYARVRLGRPLRTGNLTIRSVSFGARLVEQHGRYRIQSLLGPQIDSAIIRP